MGDELEKTEVCRFLEKADLRAERIPVDKSKRCDLWAQDDNEKYLIEIKSFHDDETIKKDLRTGKFYEHTHRHAYRGNVAKEIRDAIKQLKSTATGYDDHLWLVALLAKSRNDATFMSEQIVGTLYGVGAITDSEAGGACRKRRCLYFSESAFYRHPDLDGAIVLHSDEIVLYMNDYGRRLDRMRQSGLARFLAEHNASYDMATMESRNDCLVADFEMDRANREAVLERLKQKYPGRKLQHMNWRRWEGIDILNLSSNPND